LKKYINFLDLGNQPLANNYLYKKDLKKKIDFAYNNLDRFDFNTNLKKYFETITNFF